IFDSVGKVSIAYNTFTFTHNLVNGPLYHELASMPGVILADPLFVDRANGDFRLRMDSPAIDAGIAVDGFLTDIDGAPRPVKSIEWEERGDGSGTDIGAYEFQMPI